MFLIKCQLINPGNDETIIIKPTIIEMANDSSIDILKSDSPNIRDPSLAPQPAKDIGKAIIKYTKGMINNKLEKVILSLIETAIK